MSDSVKTPIIRNPPLVHFDKETSCTTSRIKWELDCLIEEATQKVEQTFGCAPVDEDNIFSYCTTSTGSNIICRGTQPPQQRQEKQYQLRKQELQEELKYVKERQERLHRKRKALQRQMQLKQELKQQKKRQLWVTQLNKERHEEHRRIRQELDPCP